MDITAVITDIVACNKRQSCHVSRLPVGESNVIGQEDHALGQLLSPMVPEGSTLQSKPTITEAVTVATTIYYSYIYSR